MAACCEDPQNLTEVSRQAVPSGQAVVQQCAVCGRRHHLFLTEPVVFGIRLPEP